LKRSTKIVRRECVGTLKSETVVICLSF